ncbi:MAG TPA: aldo/keto reductase [Chitinophagaceae bacterium]|nr:aldo/keto reductase [Chitinophagaceae bacterium]
MQQKILSIHNTPVPALGLGTYKLTGKQGQADIERALLLGYRHLDTAEFYGNETEVGNAVKNSGIARDEIFITTKVWPSNFSRKQFIPCVQDSLRKLKTGAVDLLLLHWPANDDTNKLACELLNECLYKQYTKLVGVSNFSVTQLKQAQNIAPVCCNQVEYSPYNNNSSLLQYMQQQGMLLTAYSPLARGAALNEDVIQQLAARHRKTASQIVLRWLLQQDNVAAIPKAGSERHSIENLSIFDFMLSGDDMQLIFSLSTR